MYKILIVEDDQTIATSLSDSLSQWDYTVEYIKDFKKVLEHFETYQPHLVLLDIALPFFDGYHWGREIRKVSNVPIMFLSSMSDNMNVVMAIRMGGDDFIAKPFDLNIVIAKIQALLRRTYSLNDNKNLLEHDGLQLNLSNASVSFNNKQIELSKNEFKILHILLENLGKVISRDTIMTRLWESESFIDDNTLTVNVTRLRKRLLELGLTDYIITKKGLGYMVKSHE